MNFINDIDIFVQNYFASIRSEQLTDFFYFFTKIFDASWLFLIIAILISVVIFKLKNFNYTFLFLGSLFITAGITYILKILFNVARPENALLMAEGHSFPSYHAASSAVFFIMIFYIFRTYFTGIPRYIFQIFCGLLLIIVSVSRMYLGVHWLTDVLGGVVLGCLICYFSIFIFKKYTYK